MDGRLLGQDSGCCSRRSWYLPATIRMPRGRPFGLSSFPWIPPPLPSQVARCLLSGSRLALLKPRSVRKSWSTSDARGLTDHTVPAGWISSTAAEPLFCDFREFYFGPSPLLTCAVSVSGLPRWRPAFLPLHLLCSLSYRPTTSYPASERCTGGPPHGYSRALRHRRFGRGPHSAASVFVISAFDGT